MKHSFSTLFWPKVSQLFLTFQSTNCKKDVFSLFSNAKGTCFSFFFISVVFVTGHETWWPFKVLHVRSTLWYTQRLTFPCLGAHFSWRASDVTSHPVTPGSRRHDATTVEVLTNDNVPEHCFVFLYRKPEYNLG